MDINFNFNNLQDNFQNINLGDANMLGDSRTQSNMKCVMVIFGGTGDLTHRKLMPALYNLSHGGFLPDEFAVVSVGRREKTNEEYRNEVSQSIQKFSRLQADDTIWNELVGRIYYFQLEFTQSEGYTQLKAFLSGLDAKYGTAGNRVFYLAVAPEYFGSIARRLNEHGMVINEETWQRLMIEKPFGKDLKSARQLNEIITEIFTEKNTYRIDHYLGKEMLQNIMAIRFANMLFEPIWNSRYIDNIQISAMETVGVENRGGYYEESGALKDMVQNHLLQLMTLTAMESPYDLSADAVRDEKVKVLRSLELFTPEIISKNVVRGQYGPGHAFGKELPGYRQEDRVKSDSMVETYFAMKLNIGNFRWAGTPFYIRTGKRMPTKYTDVIIQFKQQPGVLYFKEHGELEPNLLIIRIQPSEGVYLRFNAKRPGTDSSIIPVQMDFCQNCMIYSNSPEAYERLISDVMKGDSTLFSSWREVEYSWKFVDRIQKTWRSAQGDIPKYAVGTSGPEEADALLAMDGRKWWNL